MYNYLIFIVLLVSSTFAQTVYKVPFASKGNTIELEIVNSAAIAAENILVKSVNKPGWIVIETKQQMPGKISANEEISVSFSFSVDRTAPIDKEGVISFEISNGTDQWTKEITVSVQAPKKLELSANYPNPFNPVTTIGFTLPDKGKVKLEIYNMLGQKVIGLIDSKKEAGYHNKKWDARNFASGVYFYRLEYTDSKGKQKQKQRKLTLIR